MILWSFLYEVVIATHLQVRPLPDLVDVVGPLGGGEAGGVVADHVLDGVARLELLPPGLAVHPRGNLYVRERLLVGVVRGVLGKL